jgi:hypothetical protein
MGWTSVAQQDTHGLRQATLCHMKNHTIRVRLDDEEMAELTALQEHLSQQHLGLTWTQSEAVRYALAQASRTLTPSSEPPAEEKPSPPDPPPVVEATHPPEPEIVEEPPPRHFFTGRATPPAKAAAKTASKKDAYLQSLKEQS